jgi:acyl carrier protein
MTLDHAAIAQTIVTIVAEQLSKPQHEIDANVHFDKLGMDSLDRVEVVMKIEEQFGIEMNDERIDSICTVNELVAYVEELKQG